MNENRSQLAKWMKREEWKNNIVLTNDNDRGKDSSNKKQGLKKKEIIFKAKRDPKVYLKLNGRNKKEKT